MFEYYGITSLREVLTNFRGLLETDYQNILGQELYSSVKEAEAAFVNENSFVENKNKECGFSCSSSLGINNVQMLKPIFYFSDAGAKKFSASTGLFMEYLPAFVHCFNNFIIYLVQEIPMVFALKLISHRFYSESLETDATQKAVESFSPGKVGFLNRTEDDFQVGGFDEKRIYKIIAAELFENMREEQIKEDLAMLFAGIIINGSLAANVLAMDRQVFIAMGLDISKYPRHAKNLTRQMAINNQKLKGDWFIPIGDILEGHSFLERLTMLSKWLKLFPAQRNGNDNVFNQCRAEFLESLQWLDIVKI